MVACPAGVLSRAYHRCSLPRTPGFLDHQLTGYFSLRQNARGRSLVNRGEPNQEMAAIDRVLAELACVRHSQFKNFPSPG